MRLVAPAALGQGLGHVKVTLHDVTKVVGHDIGSGHRLAALVNTGVPDTARPHGAG